MKKIFKLSNKELNERIEKNYSRLQEPYYQIENVFSDLNYDWPGDKEGRALLAFVCHYKIHGKEIPCMRKMVEQLRQKTNSLGYFGSEDNKIADEQQISGHSWYLRGLLEYYQQFKDERVLEYAKSTVNNLYMPLKEKIHDYPLKREQCDEGGVSGNVAGIKNGWRLSTDVACVFMSIDGLSHYYEITKDSNVESLIKEMQTVFDGIDVVELNAQTHCCLTAARGFLRMYRVTYNADYLNSSIRIATKYTECGMTDTYQNYNWWGRGNTWTEPCAVVDSLIVMTELYKITENTYYRTLAARIWHNGFAALQVGNGGAGTDTTVDKNQNELYCLMYEAYFCCTMRLAEGLRYAYDNRELLYAELDELKKDEKNRYMAGDIIYAERKGVKALLEKTEKYEMQADEDMPCFAVSFENHYLQPLAKYYRLPKDITDNLRQKVIFD